MSHHPRGLPLASVALGGVLAVLLAFSLGAPRRLASLIGSGKAEHRLDGRVTPGEYRFQWTDDASKLSFSWTISGDRLLGAITTPDTGWVAVGFGGQGPLMFGADIIMGAVDGSGAHLGDRYANSPTDQAADTTLGGRNDVATGAGLQTAAGTTIEFERSLATHDSTDQPIEAGQTHVILASASDDDFTVYHSGGSKAVALLDLFNGPPAASAHAALLPDHLDEVQIFLATWAALMLIIGFHGLAAGWMETGPGPAADPGALDVATILFPVLILVELVALGTFGVGIVVALPVWVLGLALAVGLLALAGIVAAYSRAFVPLEVVKKERDDGIPW